MRDVRIKSFFILGTTLLLAAPMACQKNYTLAPLPVIPTATPTMPPCGYPGNTCTPTFSSTPTFTFTNTFTWTKTNTPTITSTPTFTVTPTSTPTPLPTLAAPQGFVGWPEEPQNYMQVIWLASSDPNVTSYKVYRGPSSGAMTLWATVANSPGVLGYTDISTTTFNEYVCVVASGNLPDSPPSNIVHAISGTTALNTLAINASSSLTPTFSSTGTVTGAFERMWMVVTPGGTVTQWIWGDLGNPLTASVNYGFNGFGLTYILSAPALTSATSYNSIVATFNNAYWCIDYSGVNFTTP